MTKPPHERGSPCRSHISVAALQAFSSSTASAETTVRGERVSIRPLLWTRTLVVKDESSTVRTPLERQDPCFGIVGAAGMRGRFWLRGR